MRRPKTKRSSLKSVPVTRDYYAAMILLLIVVFITLAALGAIAVLSLQEPGDTIPVPFIIISLLFLLPEAAGVASSLRGYLRARKLDLEGRLTQGTLVDQWIEEGSSDEPDKYFVEYQFGQDIRVTQKVKDREFQTLAVGKPVPVRYLPDNPTCSRMEP